MPRPTRDQILLYAEDALLNGLTKKESYQKNINADLTQIGHAVIRLEKSQEYLDIRDSLMSDDSLRLRKKAIEIRGKYAKLIETNIDTMQSVLEGVVAGEIADKAIAVRLANETIGAMSMVDAPQQVNQPGSIDKSSAVQ